MSLVHFTITNPGWKPSLESEKYLTGLRYLSIIKGIIQFSEQLSLNTFLFIEKIDFFSGNNKFFY